MGGHSRRRGRPDRVFCAGHVGTREEETAAGEKRRQNQVGNDETSVHHSRPVRCNETPGPEADPINLCRQTS